MPSCLTTGASGAATFDSVYSQISAFPPPLLPPDKPYDRSITHQISDLFVHPTLEAALHLLNHDLPSAHFLVRHMQAAPKYEGMYLHGILHRVEGDYDNARAWYSDVAESDVFASVWGTPAEGGPNRAQDFIKRIQDVRAGQGDEAIRRDLESESIREIEKVVEFCRQNFGTARWDDVSDEWEQPTEGKVKEMSQDMVTGDKGFRKF